MTSSQTGDVHPIIPLIQKKAWISVLKLLEAETFHLPSSGLLEAALAGASPATVAANAKSIDGRKTALQMCVQDRSCPVLVVKALVEAGAEFDYQFEQSADVRRRSALMIACQLGRTQVALLLIEHKADVRLVACFFQLPARAHSIVPLLLWV